MRFFLFLTLACWAGLAVADNAVVAPNVHANLRSGKTEAYRVVRVLGPKESVEILQVDGPVAQVRTRDGETGWVPVRLLTIQDPPTPPARQTASPAPGRDQQALDQARQELETAQSKLAELQDRLAEEQRQAESVWVVVAVVAACALVLGALLGIAGLQAYYRKRLNGLRI